MRWSSQLHVSDLQQLGAGGHGQVYAAKLLAGAGISQDVVIKLVRGASAEDVRMGERFLEEEARLLAKLLHHPNVIQLRDYNIAEIDGVRRPYLMLEHGGVPLAALMRSQGGRIETGHAAFIAIEVLRGLAYAHEHDIVHRDVKPGNVLVGWHGQVKLIDFGIAKAEDSTQATTAGLLKGTPVYISPEAFAGEKLDGRADVWAVGVMLYEMLLGRPPWIVDRNQPEAAYIRQISTLVMEADVPEPPDEMVPKRLADVIKRMLAKKRGDRYDDASTAMHDLLRETSHLIKPWAIARELGQQAYASDPKMRSALPLPNASTLSVLPDKRREAWVSVALLPSVVTSASMASMLVPPELYEEGPDSGAAESVRSPGPSDFEVTAQVRHPRRSRLPRFVGGVAVSALVVLLATGVWWVNRGAPSLVLSQDKQPRQGLEVAVAKPGAAPREGSVAQMQPGVLLASRGNEVPAPTASEGRVKESASTVSSDAPAVADAMRAADSGGVPLASSDSLMIEKVIRPQSGTLEIVVLPLGAFVSLDGQPPVKAPIAFQKLPTGTHVLRLGLEPDRLDRVERVRVRAGTNRVRVKLADPFGPSE